MHRFTSNNGNSWDHSRSSFTKQPSPLWIVTILLYNCVISSSYIPPITTHRHVFIQNNRRENVYTAQQLYLYQNADDFSSSDTDDEDKGVGLYIHIPYCRRRCRYCSFAIVPIGPAQNLEANSGFLDMDKRYKDAILSELQLIRTQLDHNNTQSPRTRTKLRSIYFGGGTPSLAPTSTIQSILEAIYKNESTSPFYVSDLNKLELSIEMDPGTFNLQYLEALKNIGFNRISLGVQSFQDDILQLLGRTHRYADILTSIEYISQVGIENYSIDLISGLPLLDVAVWAETLEIATTKLHPCPTHLSIYDLQVEKGTVFGKWYPDQEEDHHDVTKMMAAQPNKPTLPSLEDSAFMYRYASGYLRSKGYDHYEISSYARRSSIAGRGDDNAASIWRSQHNQLYWETGAEWYAVGLGATSFLQGLRYTRPSQMKDYIDWVHDQRRESSEHSPRGEWVPPWMGKEEEEESEESLLQDVLLTRLRTKEGLDLQWVSHLRNGSQKVSAILKGAQLGMDLGLIQKNNDSLRLVDPNGFLFSNELIASIFYEVEMIHEKPKISNDITEGGLLL